METINLEDFLSNGLLKEKEFRNKTNQVDWQQYKGKKVLIKGCTSVPVPLWSYLVITAQLSRFADQVLYGEACSAVSIFKRKN